LWYRSFRAIARDHIASKNAPELSLAPLPEEIGWDPNPRVIAAQESEVDTFGLAEMAEYDTDAEDWEDSDKASESTDE
jgi:hypothetical protein